MSLQATLAIAITVMVAAIGVLFALKPPDATNQILTGLISTVLTVFVMVYSFYFGSSSGSKDKDDTVKQIALGAPAPEQAAKSDVVAASIARIGDELVKRQTPSG